MRRDARVGGQQGGERLALDRRRLRGVVHHVVRVLAADRGAELEHHRLGHDQPAAQLEVLPHALPGRPEAAHDLAEPRQHVAGGDAGALLGGVHHQAGRAVGLVLGQHRLERQRHLAAHLGGRRDDVLAELGVALLRHGRAADRAGRHRLLDLAELGLHQRVDLAADLAAGRGQQAEQADVLGEMVELSARDGTRHRAEAEMAGDARLHRRPLLAERREGAGAAAQHGDEQARRRAGAGARRGAAARRSRRRP